MNTKQQSPQKRQHGIHDRDTRWRWLVLVVLVSMIAAACSSGATTTESLTNASEQSSPDPTETGATGVVDANLSGAVTIETEIDFSSEPFQGTFMVTDGSDVLGCAGGTFVDTPTARFVEKELTCETGSRTGTITVAFNPTDGPGPGDQNGPWSIERTTGEFDGLRGDGQFSVVYDSNEPTGVETLTGEITYEPVATEDTAQESENGVSGEEFLAEAMEGVWLPDDAGALLVTVIDDDGQVVHAAKGSDGDGNTPQPDDTFRVGSITKIFTSVLTLSLVEDGLVDLNTPAIDYLSTVAVPAEVTVRDLLGHRSGIANYTDAEGFFDTVGADLSKVWAPTEIVDRVADSPAEFEPGTTFGYSNTNYILLGLLIEEVTGQPYTAVLEARILEPLGMDSTYLAGAQDGPEPFSGHSSFFTGDLAPIHSDYTSVATSAWTAGAMVSSPGDLHLFLTGLFDGHLIGADLVREMTSTDESYGLGIERDPTGNDAELYGHSGGIIGYTTMVLHAPESGWTGFWVGTADFIEPKPAVDAVAPTLVTGTITAAGNDNHAEAEGVPVVIENEVEFGENGGSGTFAVTEGSDALGCSNGSFEESGGPDGIVAVMTCESGPSTGSFTLVFQPGNGPGPGDVNGPWWVEAAEGDFAELTGSGDFAAFFDEDDEGAEATFTGEIASGR